VYQKRTLLSRGFSASAPFLGKADYEHIFKRAKKQWKDRRYDESGRESLTFFGAEFTTEELTDF